jgi:hypothetical protein
VNQSSSVLLEMIGICIISDKVSFTTSYTSDQIFRRTFLLDPSSLINAKLAITNNNNSNPTLQVSLKQLLLQANLFLMKSPTSVIEKTQLPASGNKHDYLSLSPYDWPDPTKPFTIYSS